MQAVLHFPPIQISKSAWLSRSLLYWDKVGTIVPRGWIDKPDQLGPYTQDLVQRGLVRQVFPEEAASQFGSLFERWLESLGDDELMARSARFQRGDRAPIHADKWMAYPAGLNRIVKLGLATRWRDGWIEVESRTAADFMAGLALSLCHPESGLHRQEGCLWVPTTADPAALRSLLEGLAQLDDEPRTRVVRLRVEGEIHASEIRLSLLDHSLPVPGESLEPDLIERIRARHGDALPACRRRLEAIIDSVIDQASEVLRVRILDRARSEIDDLVRMAEAYLQEGGVRRVAHAPVIRLLKATPVAGLAVGAVQETAAELETATHMRSAPLAYLALANAEVKASRYGAVRRKPLIEQFTS